MANKRTKKEHSAQEIAKDLVQKAKTEVLEQERLKKSATGFMDFIRTQGVVGLAVGLAIGTQAGATVKSMVEGFVNPIVGFLVGNQTGLLNAGWNVVGKDSQDIDYWFTLGNRTMVIKWGSILSSIITLLAVAGVIYFVVKGLKLDRLDKKKDS